MTDSSDDYDKETLRLWLQMVKFTLPVRRHVNIQLQKELGHGLTRFDVLAQLAEFGEQKVGELAQNLINSSGNIASLLDRMEGRELVERRVDNGDGRLLIVKITEKGRRVYDKMVLIHRRIVSDRLGGIDAETRQTLITALKTGRMAIDQD